MSKPGAFMESLIRCLLPIFIGPERDLEAVRADIIEAINDHGARTRAEMLAAARIIAFRMATLDTLSGARAGDVPLPLKPAGTANRPIAPR